MPEGATFPKIEPLEPVAVKFTTLWYSSDMEKQWQLNTVFHTYYLQLKRPIDSFPRMTLNTLQRFRSFVKFHTDRHFIYITVHGYKHKEEMQSYYKLTKEDMEEITKEWLAKFLIPIDQAELSEPDLIRILVVTHEEYDAPNSSRRKKKEEVHDLNSASEETASDSPRGEGDDEVDKEEKKGEEDKHKQGKVKPPRDPIDEVETSKKRKVSPMKPTSRNKSKSIKP
jgi:hypothetical protein